eukprot:jgi/Botrbrau1/2265/Bobra.101_2s0089.2
MPTTVLTSSLGVRYNLGSRSRSNLERRLWLPVLPFLVSTSICPRHCRAHSTAAAMGIVREQPGPGQESVWDYPRPPRVDPVSDHVVVLLNGEVIAETRNAVRILETSHPPVYYIPPQDVKLDRLTRNKQSTYCEWKGRAAYYDSPGQPDVAWFYPDPVPAFQAIKDYVAFYPSKVDSCSVNGEKVAAQQGDFYGGWITSKVVGPFKGGLGTWGW